MASHRLNPLYAIKECSTCGSLYTKECCSIGSFEDKILTPVPDSSPRCARCGTPVDGPSCRGCAFLRKKFDEDLLAYCVENGIFQDFQNTSESSDDNTNVVNALREPCVVNQDPGVKFSQEPPQIDHNCCYECGDSLDGIFCQRCICKSCGKGAHYGYNCPPKDPIISKPEPCNQTINEIPQTLPSLDPSCYSLPHVSKPNFVDNSPNFSYPPPQLQFETYLCELCGNNAHYGYDCSPQFPFRPNSIYDSSGFVQPQNPPQDLSIDHQGILQALNKMQEELEEIKRDRRKKIEDMSIEEMRHEQQLVDYKIKDITNDLGYKRFRGEKIDEEYERDCEIRIRKLKQDFNEWGSEVRKKEQAYNEEQYSAARRRMLSITFDDEDDYIPLGDIIARYSTSKAITPDLPIEEPDNSLSMGDEHLDTTSSIEILVPIPSELEGISDDTCDVPVCDDSSTFDALNDNSEILSDSNNDDTSSDDDDFEDVEYVSLEEVNDDQEEKEFDLEDIFQIQDVILREKLLNVHRLISNIESLKDNPTPDRVLESPSPFPIPVVDSDSFLEESDTSLSHLDNSLPEFETSSDHTEETRSGNMEEIDIFLASDDSIPPGVESDYDSEGDILFEELLNDDLVPLAEYNHFTFDIEPDTTVKNDFDELNEDECFNPGEGLNQQFLKTLVFGVVSRFTRASYPLFEISLGRSDIVSSYRLTSIFA
ncbi:hypothetical protein Tco_0433101 [Tanacetum coccineum]